MKTQTASLEAYTDEELDEALARVLAQFRGEVLSDAEAQQVRQLESEIQRRHALSVAAA